MNTSSLTPNNLGGVFAVPPLARDADRTVDLERNKRIVQHVTDGGIRRLLYGGNAFLYHISLSDYHVLLDWLAGLSDDLLVIPSAGPTYGRAMDQAEILRKHQFPAVMMLPCRDPRRPDGLETGIRRFAEQSETPVLLYLKSETNFGADRENGLDTIGRLVEDGICTGIKYAIVREVPRNDEYLEQLLERVGADRVISGIGERPAIVHLREWELNGFTTGSGCIAPGLCRALFRACNAGDFKEAGRIRELFLPMEDQRDALGPSRVLHAAVREAEIAETGPVLPFLSAVSDSEKEEIGSVARSLAAREDVFRQTGRIGGQVGGE